MTDRQHGIRAGVIIIGSNSARMLTANLDPPLSQPIRSRRETRLFLQLQENHRRDSVLSLLTEAVFGLQQDALAAGAQKVSLYATAALRDEADNTALQQAILQHTGLRLRVISGKQEAAWSFLGAARPYPGQQVGIIDIGGGSTELALGTRDKLAFARSLQLGAARLHGMQPILNPEALAPARAIVLKTLAESLPPVPFSPGKLLAVGGTGTALMGLISGSIPSPDLEEDLPFTFGEANQALLRLASLPPEKRGALPGMTPGREHILPTGLVILTTLMERLRISAMSVTQRNNTDGCLWQQAAVRADLPFGVETG